MQIIKTHFYVKVCALAQRGRWGGGYSGFQVTGMIEGFFGFEIFDSRIFLGMRIWQVFFGVARFK